MAKAGLVEETKRIFSGLTLYVIFFKGKLHLEIETRFMGKMVKIIFLFFLLAGSSLSALTSQKWEGSTNEKGKVSISFEISSQKIFSLQGYILYQKNWRPVSVFWNKKKIWFDLGPPFKNLRYKVFLIFADEPQGTVH